MTSTSGNKISRVIIDSDAIIGAVFEEDKLHKGISLVWKYLNAHNIGTLILPITVIEAATALARRKYINRPDLASKILKYYQKIVTVPSKEKDVLKLTASLYNSQTSRKNTPFDYYVLATAKKLGIKVVFSFDKFYKKHGLKLAEELL